MTMGIHEKLMANEKKIIFWLLVVAFVSLTASDFLKYQSGTSVSTASWIFDLFLLWAATYTYVKYPIK